MPLLFVSEAGRCERGGFSWAGGIFFVAAWVAGESGLADAGDEVDEGLGACGAAVVLEDLSTADVFDFAFGDGGLGVGFSVPCESFTSRAKAQKLSCGCAPKYCCDTCGGEQVCLDRCVDRDAPRSS